MEESFEVKLRQDSEKLEGFVDTAIEESRQFCSSVYAEITKGFEAIDSKLTKCVASFNKEIQAISKTYAGFVQGLGRRERQVDSFAQMKVKHAKDLVTKAKARAEDLMRRTRQKIDLLEKKNNSTQQISKLLNALMEE